MRPLAVLILVLGAAAALLFALLSGSDNNPRAALIAGNKTQPVDDVRRDPAEMSEVVSDRAAVLPTAEAAQTRTHAGPADTTGAYLNAVVGTVFSPDRAPVAGARVSLIQKDTTSEFADMVRLMSDVEPPKPYRVTETEADGTFRFESIPPATNWNLFVAHDKHPSKEAGPFLVTEEGEVTENVQLDKGFGMAGFVTDANTGKPIGGAKLVLDNPIAQFLPETRQSVDRRETESDPNGRYHFPNINIGQKMLIVRAEGYATAVYRNMHFETEGQENIQRNCPLSYANLIAGRVVGPDRKGVGGVTIDAISNQHEPGSMGIAQSSADGEFVIEGLADGLYTLRPKAEGWDVEPILRVEAGDTNVEIVLHEQGSVSGVVADAATGRPLPSFRIQVRQVSAANIQAAWGHVVQKQNFRKRKDGSFKMSGLSQDTYVAQADADGYASSFSDPFTITQGMTTNDIVVRMTKGGILKGRVFDANSNEPVAGAEVRTNDNNWIESDITRAFQTMSPSALTRRKVKTDGQGYFEIPMMTPETYQVQVWKDGYTPFIKNDVTLGDGLVTDLDVITLSKGGVVRGTVFLASGGTAGGVDVTMSPIDNKVWGGLRARTDADGKYVMRNASPGRYKISASRKPSGRGSPFDRIIDIKHSEVEVFLDDGQTLVQDLYLKNRGRN